MIRWRVSALAGLALCGMAIPAVLAQQAAKSALTGSPAAKASETPKKATLDKPVMDFRLKDVTRDLKPNEKEDAAFVRLSDFGKKKKAVLLFFMSEQCSVTWRYEKRVGKLMQDCAKKDIAFLGVRCSANDTCDSIRKFAESKNFVMPVLNDEKGVVSSFFKIRQTPTFALIDAKGVLRYQGSFDDQPEEPDVTAHYVPDAIQAVLNNKEVTVKHHAVFG